MRTTSERFGLLLAHIFMGDNEALSVPSAARLLGMRAEEAGAVLEVLAQEGLLCRGSNSGERSFLTDTRSKRYKRCFRAYSLRRG